MDYTRRVSERIGIADIEECANAGGNLNTLCYKDWKIHFSFKDGALNKEVQRDSSK